MVAGAVFFVTTVWTTMTGEQKLLVILGGLEVFGLLLFGAGRLLNRGGALPEVERVLSVVMAFVVPVAAAAAGELLRSSILLGMAGALAVLVPAWFALRSVARRTEPALHPGLTAAVAALSLMAIAGGTAGDSPVSAGAVVAVVVLAIGWFAARDVIPGVGANLNPVLWSSLLVAFAALVAAGSIALAAARAGAGHPVAGLGIALSSIAVLGVLLERALTRGGKLPAARALPLLVGGLALAVAGTAVAVGNERALLVAAVFGAAAAIGAGARLPSPWLTLPGLALSAIAYAYLPAPVRALALEFRDRVATGLGYVSRPLPLSYYAVTLVPYVAVTGAVGVWLRRRGRDAHGRVLEIWTLAVAGGLCLMSIALGTDLRAPAAAFAAQGSLLLVLSRFNRKPWFVHLGAAGLYLALPLLLLHLEAGSGVHALTYGAAGFLAIAVAMRLRRSEAGDGFPARAGTALLRTTLGMAALFGAVLSVGVLQVWTDRFEYPFGAAPAAGWMEAIGFLLFVGLVAVLARIPAAVPAASLLVAWAVEGVLGGAGLAAFGEWRPVLFTAAAGWPLFLRRRLARTGGRGADVCVVIAVLALFALGLFPRVEPWLAAGWDWPGTLSVLAFAALLIGIGLRMERESVGGLAAPVLVLGGLGFASALGYDPGEAAGAVGVSAAAFLLAALSFPLRRFTRPFLVVIAAVALLVTAWLLPAAGPERYGVPLAALLAALAARLVVNAWPGERLRNLAGVTGSVVLAWAPFGLLIAVRAEPHFLALGLVAAAAIAMFWAGPRVAVRAVAGAHLLLALLAASLTCLAPGGEPLWHAVTLVLVMAGGRFLVSRLRAFGTVLFLLGLASLASLAVGKGILELDREWQPAILLGFSVVTLLAGPAPALGLSRVVANVIAGMPLAAFTGYAFVGAVGVATADEAGLVFAGMSRTALLTAAALHVLGAYLLSRRVRRAGRDAIWILALGLVAFVFAPVNLLIGGDFPRPDVEMALVALLLALRLPVRVREGGSGDAAGASVNGVYLVAAAALALTALEWRHLSTPLTLFALILPPLVLLRRSARPVHAAIGGFALLAAALSATIYAFPEGHAPETDILVALSVACALVLLFLRHLAGWAHARSGGAVPKGTGRCLVAPAGAAHLLSLLFLAANIVVAPGNTDAGGAILLAAILSMGTGAFVSLRIATTLSRPAAVHGTVVSLLLLYAFLAVRTGLLDVLDGYHGHALIVIGTGIFLAAERVPSGLRGHLRADGLLLSAPAVLVALLQLLGPGAPTGSTASAFFLAGASAGVAAARLRRAVLGAASVILLNLAIFALWRRHGIVDPAFYGVPPGLTLLLGAELSRKHLAKEGRLILFLIGATLLYGSVGIQVLSVERPDHALVLFGLGIATVGFGVVLRRNALLAAGTTVVVLDVVAYLARHGFQRGFLGAALLLMAGMTVLSVGTLAAKRRKRGNVPGP